MNTGINAINEAVQEAVERNLGLLAERYNLAVADARIITARLRPNPVLSAGADYLDWLGAGFSLASHDLDMVVESVEQMPGRYRLP